jgi:hypothetical protein
MPAMKNLDTRPRTAGMAILASLALLGCEQPTPPPAEATLVRAV